MNSYPAFMQVCIVFAAGLLFCAAALAIIVICNGVVSRGKRLK